MKQLLQVLEIVDALSVEEENGEVFDRLFNILHNLNLASVYSQIKSELALLVEQFGFQHVSETDYQTIGEYVSSLSEKRLHSYEFLTLPPER